MRSLYFKLSAALLLLLLLLGTVTALLTVRTSRMYMLEVQQKLHRDLAAQVIEDQPLLQDSSAREQALDRMFEKLMVINPDLEVYLLDGEGRVLGYSAPPGRVRQETVDLTPVRALLDGENRLPILGTDPRNPETENIFSVAPLNGDRDNGYLYIVLASEQLGSVASMVETSYILRTGILMVAGSLLLALVGGLVMFRRLTARLRRLAWEINDFEGRVLWRNGRGAVGEDQGAPPAADPFAPSAAGPAAPSAAGPPAPPAAGPFAPPAASVAPPAPSGLRRFGDEVDALERGFRDMSRKISRQLGELEAQDRERRDLLANISHDVRTPLTHLQGYLETMQMKGDALSREERQEYLQIAVQRSEQLGRLVADLLDLAKLEVPVTLLEQEEFSVAELVQDVAQQFQLAAREGGLELDVRIDAARAQIHGNLGTMERALQNLIENAVRYTRPGDRVDVVVEQDEDVIEIAIRDNGPGIPPDELEHVFDRFYRCSARTRGSQEGSGLGLSIARRALELHGANLICESRVGEGTTFRFALACTSASA